MTLFQILTRKLASGKIKATRCARSCCADFVAAGILAVCLVIAPAATAATSGYSAAALFNQANASARDGKPGLAVLNYERAQLLAPNDPDIAANLHYVRAKAGLPEVSENWLTRSLTCVRPNTSVWLGSFGLALAGLCLLLVRLYPRQRLAFRSLTFAGALLVVTALVTALGSAIAIWPRVNEAVIMAREAAARTSPVLAAEPAFKLPEGETVMVRAEHQDFTLVQTTAGRSGWVSRADLALVVPQAGTH